MVFRWGRGDMTNDSVAGINEVEVAFLREEEEEEDEDEDGNNNGDDEGIR
jgi:hypothetical protein